METQHKTMNPEISIVVPIFNEEENVEPLVWSVEKVMGSLGRPWELIFVDDGSTDGTFGKLRAICRSQKSFRVIRLRRDFGQTAALSAGFGHARGGVIITMDGDLQNDPDDIPVLLKLLEEGYDIVNGWRRERKDIWLTKVLPSLIANWLVGRMTGVKLHDYGCSLKAYRSEVIKEIPLYGELHRFIPALAAIHGARITEAPVRHHPRLKGKSKYTPAKAFRVLMDLMIVIFLKTFAQKPFHVFGWMGLIFFLLGVGVDGYLTLEKIFLGMELAGRPMLLFGTLLILAGLQLFSMGILAEIQVRTYHESQGKPIYTIREIIN
ncbi:MAG TPA: glycosyltransferase family 2 protein [Nitrospiria bacterium]|jgi:glycosyltransferase involved in cell wall biosynthesis|nr:glycosyltransferase family 2 protein [Nitrospiria bacterium]